MGVTFLMLIQGTAFAQSWSLQQCIDTALSRNRALKISENHIKHSEERLKEVKASRIPKLSATADYKYYADQPYQLMPQSAFGGPEGLFKEVQMGVPHNITAAIQVSAPLLNPRIRNEIEIGRKGVEMSGLQHQQSLEQLVIDVSAIYYNAQVLIHQMAFVDSNMQNMNSLRDNVILSRSQGMATGSDLAGIELSIDQLKTQKLSLQSNYQLMLNQLKFLMGISIDRELKLQEKLDEVAFREYPVRETLRLRLAGLRMDIQNKKLKGVKLAHYPSVSLYGSYGQMGMGYDKAPNEFLNFYPTSFAGINLSLPLFNGTLTRKKLAQERLGAENSRIELEILEEQELLQVANATLQRKVKGEIIQDIQSQIKLAGKVYQDRLLQQKQGTASLADVLNADNALREAQRDYITAIVEFLNADLELKQISGNINTVIQ